MDDLFELYIQMCILEINIKYTFHRSSHSISGLTRQKQKQNKPGLSSVKDKIIFETNCCDNLKRKL